MEKIIIQKEISITQKEMDNVIDYYKNLSLDFHLGILSTILNKYGIISEIKKLSKIGKEILLMRYKFKEFEINFKKEEGLYCNCNKRYPNEHKKTCPIAIHYGYYKNGKKKKG